MDRLFRQRMEYIERPPSEGCFLCDYSGDDDDAANLVLVRRGTSLLFMNAYPYNTGHLLAAPKRHAASVEDLEPVEVADVMSLVAEAIRALKEVMSPEGFNIGANLGEFAGAGLPGHFHMHIVPRWKGDTNFMPVIGESKVLPEPLEDTYSRLRPRFASGSG